MLRMLPALTLLFCLSAPAVQAGGHGAAPAADAKQARLQERVELFSRAFGAGDVPLLDSMLAPNYTHTNDKAPPLDRAAWLASMERRRADIESGTLVTTEFSTTEAGLNVAGDTAVATGLSVMRGQRGDFGFALRIRFTSVWHWDGQDWYRVAFHDTYEPLAD
jgi:ketosteroid isomerase-like protein